MTAAQSISFGLRSREDHELMQEIASSSVIAFEELLDRYGNRAYRVASAICRDRETAEDAVQDAFASVWRDRCAYRPEREMVAAWLLSSVGCKATIRRDQADARQGAPADLIETRPAADDLSTRAVDAAARLRAPFERIPGPLREVITLAVYGQLTYSEIATHLQLPAATVKGRMRLGLRELQAHLDDDAA